MKSLEFSCMLTKNEMEHLDSTVTHRLGGIAGQVHPATYGDVLLATVLHPFLAFIIVINWVNSLFIYKEHHVLFESFFYLGMDISTYVC
jgi:hypothetical protein